MRINYHLRVVVSSRMLLHMNLTLWGHQGGTIFESYAHNKFSVWQIGTKIFSWSKARTKGCASSRVFHSIQSLSSLNVMDWFLRTLEGSENTIFSLVFLTHTCTKKYILGVEWAHIFIYSKMGRWWPFMLGINPSSTNSNFNLNLIQLVIIK